jgi:hypothetical protein
MAREGGRWRGRALPRDAALAVALLAIEILLTVLEPRSFWPPSRPLAVAA